MPYYRWFAINLSGDEFEGELWAVDEKSLEDLLLKKELGLMWAERKKISFHEKMSLIEQTQFFEQVYNLVNAGLLISPALSVVSRHGSQFKRDLFFELSESVKHGGSFAHSLLSFPHLFNKLLIALIQAGEDSGNLVASLFSVVSFLNMQVSLRKKINNALQGPLIILIFFVVIVFVIFLVIIPSFERLTIMTHQQLPVALGRLVSWSQYLQTVSTVNFLLWMLISFLIFFFFIRTSVWRCCKDWFVTHCFWIQSIYWDFNFAFFFRAVSLLMSGGKSLVESLQFLGLHIENVYVKNTFLQFAQKIAGGISVDEAYEESFGRKVRPEVTMMLLVGNESGALSAMMDQISRLYFERAEKKLNRFALILQPLLLIVMGLLVGALIYTVYMPLTQLPEMLSTI